MDKVLEKPTTLAESVKSAIEREILNGTFSPGDRLREDIVGRQFGASRTPVREAFKLLAAAGLIEIKPHVGAVVRQFRVDELIEMFQVMAELEALAARLAAKNISENGRRQLELAQRDCARLAKKGDFEGFYSANLVFHEAIYTASENSFLQKEIEALRLRLNAYRREITYYPGRMQASIPEHERVLKAIVSGDAETAARAMRSHVNLLGDSFPGYLKKLVKDSQRNMQAAVVEPRRKKPKALKKFAV